MQHPVVLLALAAASNQQFVPTFPFGIIGWIVCNSQKRNAFGGWLLFFYWQLYSGVVMTVVFFWTNFQSYVPENFIHPAKYHWFLAATVPTLLIFFLQVAVGTILIGVRTWDVLQLLRWVTAARVVAAIVATGINSAYFPNDVRLTLTLILIPEACWMVYFFTSRRVQHVFQSHDWDTAVQEMHPTETGLSISLR